MWSEPDGRVDCEGSRPTKTMTAQDIIIALLQPYLHSPPLSSNPFDHYPNTTYHRALLCNVKPVYQPCQRCAIARLDRCRGHLIKLVVSEMRMSWLRFVLQSIGEVAILI